MLRSLSKSISSQYDRTHWTVRNLYEYEHLLLQAKNINWDVHNDTSICTVYIHLWTIWLIWAETSAVSMALKNLDLFEKYFFGSEQNQASVSRDNDQFISNSTIFYSSCL